MDTDALKNIRKSEWLRLEELADQNFLSGAESDELIELYQRTAADLSEIKTTQGTTHTGEWLSVVLSKARLKFTGVSKNPLSQLPEFFLYHLPAALYRVRWLSFAAALFTILVSGLWVVWALADPMVLANYGDEETRQQFVENDFVNYYSENPAASFMGLVWTNNAWIAAQCIAFGVSGVWVPYVLMMNAQNLGISAAIMFAYDKGDVFFLYILPHGLLELTAIFVAAGAGLHIFWSLVAPGPRKRLVALGEEARAAFTIVIGLVITLFVAGIIEGFVTPQDWHPAIKIGIGSLALLAFLWYMLVQGRKATRAGYTGDLSAFDSGSRELVAG